MLSVGEKLTEASKITVSALDDFFRSHNVNSTKLYEAMEYSTMCGGKRIRPFLVLEFCRMLGGNTEAAVPYAAAIEMIHTFSLIHDDLPCMDNDDFRRGKPTCHKVFGEAEALLAGDSLIFSAIEEALSNKLQSSENRVRAVNELVFAAGADGMCEGQMLDIYCEKRSIPFERLLSLHEHKTGALIRCASKLGAIAAGADENAIIAADKFGAGIGLAFQIVDDILDKNGSFEKLGKLTGSDEKNEKTTFLSFMSVSEALEYAKKITKEACNAISGYENSETLIELAWYLVERSY